MPTIVAVMQHSHEHHPLPHARFRPWARHERPHQRPITLHTPATTAGRIRSILGSRVVLLVLVLATSILPGNVIARSQPVPDPPSSPQNAVPSAQRVLAALQVALRQPHAVVPPDGMFADGKHEFSVMLMERGRVLGRGTDSVPLTALTRAMDHARTSQPPVHDALQRAALETRLRATLLSVEVGAPPLPLEIASFSDADLQVRPGLEALLATSTGLPAGSDNPTGTGRATIYPATILMRGHGAAQALTVLVAEASGDATLAMPGVPEREAAALRDRGWQFSRRRVSHAVELTPDGPPLELVRGSRVVTQRNITLAELRRWREALRHHIARRRVVRGDALVVMSEYTPSLDREGPPASPLQTCLAALATGDASWLTDVQQLSTDDPVLAAARTLALLQVGQPVRDDDVRLLAGAHAADAWNPKVPESARALVVLAMVRTSMRHPDLLATKAAQQAITSLMTATTPGALVAHMPWLGLAVRELTPQPDVPLPGAAGLLEMRALLWQRQLDAPTAANEGADLEGAILFGQGVQARRQIGWSTARPLAFAATMLRDPRLTPKEEFLPQLAGVLASVRFLRQLTVDEASVWNCPRPEAALWGVRNAPWDHRQSLEASVMTLFVLDELIESLEQPAAP